MSHVEYLNPKSVRTYIRETLRFHFKQITRENGYLNTLGDIFHEIPSRSQITNWPAVVMQFGRETYDHQNQDQWYKRLPVTLLCYLQDGEDVTLRRETLLQDIESHFGQNNGGWQLVGEDGEYRVMMGSFDFNEPFGLVLNQPQAGIAIGFSVDYFQRIADPSATGETE